MSVPSQFRIRLPCIAGLDPNKTPAGNALTGRRPAFFSGNDLRIEFALIDADGATVISDISNVASVTVDIKTSQIVDELQATQTIEAASLNQALQQADWDGGTALHGVATFTAAESSLNLGGAARKSFWLVISYLTTDSPGKRITVYAGDIDVVEDNISGGNPVVPNGPTYYTDAQSDARYPQREEPNASFRWRNGQEQWYDIGRQCWCAVALQNGIFVSVPVPN